MGALTGNAINTSYKGLLKTSDNAALTTILKQITDGDGNTAPFSMSQTGMGFTGVIDFTGATVSGLSGMNGSSGTSGIGIAGSSGTSGTSGINGATGPAGSGGSGGSSLSQYIPWGASFGAGGRTYKTYLSLTGYGTGNVQFQPNQIIYIRFKALVGSLINGFFLNVPGDAGIGSFIQVAIYNSVTDTSAGQTVTKPGTPNTLVTGIDAASGFKSITALNYTLPATIDNTYYWAVQHSGSGYLTTWADRVFTLDMVGAPSDDNIFYRTFTLFSTEATYTFPTSVSISNLSSDTGGNSLYLGWY